MQIKKGVDLRGFQPEMQMACIVVDSVYRKHGYEAVLTSALDSEHKVGSLHGLGLAADFRTRHLIKINLEYLVKEIALALGGYPYQVLLEKDHIHVECDYTSPKD